MSDLNKYSPPPQSPELYVAASKHFQQAKMILENIPNPDQEVSQSRFTVHPWGESIHPATEGVSYRESTRQGVKLQEFQVNHLSLFPPPWGLTLLSRLAW